MLVLCAAGCVVDEEGGAESQSTSNIASSDQQNGGAESDGGKDNGDSQPTLEDKMNEIKQRVIAIMTDESGNKEEPESIFEHFCGDYVIPIFGNSGDSTMFNKVYQKDGITVNEYSDGIREYTAVKDGYIFTVVEQNGSFRLYDMVEYEDADSHVPSIFDDFGIDISMFYDKGDSSSSDEDTEEPELTADMLTVSEDLKTCAFSDAYMKEIVRLFGRSQDKTDTELEEFVKNATASGVYSVEENSVTFEISAKDDTTGNIDTIVVYSENTESGINLTMKIDYDIMSEGMTIPMSIEMSYRNVKNDGDKVVSAEFEMKMSMEMVMEILGLKYESEVTSVSTYSLSVENKNAPSLSVRASSVDTTTEGDVTERVESNITLDCTFGGDMSYVVSENGEVTTRIDGKNIALSAEGESIPAKVYELINAELAKG